MFAIPLSHLLLAIESTLLKPEDTTRDSVQALCVEAIERGFYAVCVRPEWVMWAKECLAGSAVKVVAVVGFPDGSVSTDIKVSDVEIALQSGADEFDMVLNRTVFASGNYTAVYDDIRAVVTAAKGRPVKVIMESHLLDGEELELACTLAGQAGAKFFKTCTGFTGGGATEEAVRRMVHIARDFPGVQVKASGGVRTTEQARAMLDAGATRLGVGTPSGRNIADGAIAPHPLPLEPEPTKY